MEGVALSTFAWIEEGDLVTLIVDTHATRYREGGDEYDVRVQLPKEARTSKSDLENLLVMTPRGEQVPLRSIASVLYSKAPQQIEREDQERIVRVNIDVSGRDLSTVTSDVSEVLRQVSVPNDFRIHLLLGLSYSRVKKNDDARIALERAAELNPNDVMSCHVM